MHEVIFNDKSLPTLFANRVDAIDWLDAYAKRLGYNLIFDKESFELTTFELTKRFSKELFMTGEIKFITGAEYFD